MEVVREALSVGWRADEELVKIRAPCRTSREAGLFTAASHTQRALDFLHGTQQCGPFNLRQGLWSLS